MATFNGSKHADTISGTAEADRIFGDNGNDVINGGAGNDYLDGGNGSDTLSGGTGDDVIDGGNGQDTVVLTGRRADYDFSQRSDGSILVRDLRAGAPDGTDRLISIERVQTLDGTFKIVDLVTGNAAPVARNDALTLAEDAGPTEVAAILLANDSDADGEPLRITSVQGVSAQGASVTLLPTGEMRYDAGSLFAGLETGETAIDSFTYTITDEFGLTSTATATVTITGVTHNRAPVAADDAMNLAEDAGATDVTAQLLGNDGDPDGDAFAIAAVQAVSAQGAAVTLGADGKVHYDAGAIFADLEAGQTATDTFTYTIADARGLTSTATATVTIIGVSSNTAPVAGNDRLTIPEDAGEIDLTATLLANDSDADGDALIVSAVQAVSAKGATVTLLPDGHVRYDSGQLFYSLEDGDWMTDSFTYTVTDAAGATSTATATLRIEGVTQITDAYFQVSEDGTTFDMLGSLIESFSFDFAGFEADGLLGTLNWDGVNGLLTFTADHASSDRLSPDSWQWTYFNVLGTEGENFLIGMQIFGVNDGVVAVDDALSVVEGASSGNLWATLMANDTDVDSSPIARRILSVDTTGTQGSVVFDAATKTLTYSAAGIDLAPGETITDSFIYTVSDSVSGSQPDTATVTVTVTGGGGGASFAVASAAAFEGAGAHAFDGLHFAQADILGGELLLI
ncbi:MAG TPA: Ig-like domain-containing protein [Allosphingosinicella sp.]|nr:Ig-like domain-containing protein [Allosphingosinicella sp.]